MHANQFNATTMSSRLVLLMTVGIITQAAPVTAQVTRYTTAWSGGTIAPGATVELGDGASLTGNVTANGTLKFDHTTALTTSSTISGTGTLILANTGTVTLSTSAVTTWNLAVQMPSGQLSIGSTGSGVLHLGNSGTGTLQLNGGVIKTGSVSLGRNAGSMGLATISSGTWLASRPFNVGWSGSGSLSVTGGLLENTNGAIGAVGGTGTATIAGGTWDNRGTLYVGGIIGSVTGTGTGTMMVTGGNVVSVTASLGNNVGSVGSVTVTGGTWLNKSAMYVGRDGAATLTISGSGGSGGTVIVGGTLSRTALGTINLLAGGTLQIGTGTSESGVLATDVVNHGSMVFSRTGTSSIANTISGSGGVTTSGSGTFLVTGSQSYTGPTAVANSTLLVNGAVGATAVTVGVGGILGGTGAIGGAVEVTAGGTLSPGASIESLATGSLSLLDGSAFVYEIDSLAAAPVAADLLRITGDLSLHGTVGLTLTDLATTPQLFADGTILSLINYTGDWNGGVFTYSGTTLFDGSHFLMGGREWLIDYDATVGGLNFAAEQTSANFVNIVAVPEPSTVALLAAGLSLGIGQTARRRGRRVMST